MVETSLLIHDEYYRMLGGMLAGFEEQFGAFVVLDVHSYNHLRDGADAPPTDPRAAPEINIGTYSMPRLKWAHVVDPFIEALRSFRFGNHFLDVRENVAFEGKGHQTRFIHENFAASGCAIAIEFKKFFMDEWTGRPDEHALNMMRELIGSTVPVLEQALRS